MNVIKFVDLIYTGKFMLLFNKITYATEQKSQLKISLRKYRSLQIVILINSAVMFDETWAIVETNYA